MEMRRVRSGRARWERWSGPVRCWFGNRRHWRSQRQLRVDVDGWKGMAVPLDEMNVSVDAPVWRMAEVAEGLGYSTVLHLGYGMGEAVVEAAMREPDRLRPFIESACRFGDDQLRGVDNSPNGCAAVTARVALLVEVREIIQKFPKSDPGDAASA